MRVNIKVHEMQFVVPCGEGAQTCRWLGLVAAQRYALVAPHGRCRTREDTHHKQGFYLPAAVINNNGQMLRPEQRVVDACKNDENLTVQLQQTVSVSEIGSPQFTEWTVDAFFPSRKQDDLLDRTQSAQGDAKLIPRAASKPRIPMLEPNAKRDKVLPSAEEIKQYTRAMTLQQVTSVQLLSDMEMEAAFRFDWSRLHFEEIETDSRERELVQELLLSCFYKLAAGYRHYATGSSELTYGMNGAEFAHFLHECDVARLDNPTAQIKIQEVLSQCLRYDSLVAMRNQGTLSRAGFVHALLRIVQAVFSQKDCFSATLDRIFKAQILPTITRLTSGPFRDHLHHEKMEAIFQEAKPKLVKLYDKYALAFASKQRQRTTSEILEADETSVSTPSGHPISSTWPLLLSVVGLRSMLYDCGMFCSGTFEEQTALFDRAVEQSFSGIRDESVKDRSVVFSEFLEIIARVALTVLENEIELPPQDMIKLAVEAVRSLPLM